MQAIQDWEEITRKNRAHLAELTFRQGSATITLNYDFTLGQHLFTNPDFVSILSSYLFHPVESATNNRGHEPHV